METFRKLTETLARTTTRRNLFGRGAGVAAGAMLGVAAGGAAGARSALADHVPHHTACQFPGPPCPCPGGCQSSGVCKKPCIIMTLYYASGCWVTFNDQLQMNVTCCDCDCNGFGGTQVCGCGGDHHNDLTLCPNGP